MSRLLDGNVRLDNLVVLEDNWFREILHLACVRISLPTLGDLEYWDELLENLDGHVVDVRVPEVDIVVLLPATTTDLLRLQVDPVRLARVLHQLDVSVEALRAPCDLALVQLGLGVPSVVLSPVAARCEGLIAELAFEWFLTCMHSFMHLEI